MSTKNTEKPPTKAERIFEQAFLTFCNVGFSASAAAFCVMFAQNLSTLTPKDVILSTIFAGVLVVGTIVLSYILVAKFAKLVPRDQPKPE